MLYRDGFIYQSFYIEIKEIGGKGILEVYCGILYFVVKNKNVVLRIISIDDIMKKFIENIGWDGLIFIVGDVNIILRIRFLIFGLRVV